MAKNAICLWYDGRAEEAARFYARTFPASSIGRILQAPGDIRAASAVTCSSSSSRSSAFPASA